MRRLKGFMMMVLILTVVVSTVTPFRGKVSKAADYTSAKPLPLNGTWSSDYYLTETDQEQWYQITIPSDGKLNLRLMSYVDYHDVYWKLYNADLSETIEDGDIWNASEISPKTGSYNLLLSEGSYHLKINSSYSGRYKLFGQFTSYGVNDMAAVSYDSPFKYQLGSEITGALTETDKEDWYQIVIPTEGYYTQKIVSYIWNGNDIYWKLYNADLSKTIDDGDIWNASEISPKTGSNDLVLSKGTYYLKIYANSGVGKYLFQMSRLTKDTCSHDYEKTWHDATYFKKGYRLYRCKKCGHSYKGDYEPAKKLGQPYTYIYYSNIGKGKIKLSWSSVSDASGYQIRYSKNRKMKKASVKKIKGKFKTNKMIKKLSRKKKYYVQVRAYKKSGGKTVYGKWSQKKSFRTK